MYATCSLLRRENEGIAHAFSEAHPDFEFLPAAALLTAGQVERAEELDSNGYLRLWPNRHQTDGFFAAAWQKKV